MEVQGACPLKVPNNLHLTVPNSGYNIAQQKVDGFSCALQYKVTGKYQSPKFSILKFLIRKQCACSIVLAG